MARPELRAMLTAWLVGDDPSLHRHAVNRLALLDAEERDATPVYPSLVAQAGHALAAAGRAAAAIAAARPVTVPEEEQARRLAVCRGCDRFDAARARCTVCGCSCNFKAMLATEACPIGLW